MNKDFNINSIGKRMPYTTPTDFFNDMEKNVWNNVKDDYLCKKEDKESANTHHAETDTVRKTAILRLFIRSAVSIAAVIALVFFVDAKFFKQSTVNINDVEQAYDNLSTDDQAYLLNVYQADVFINE